MRLSGERNTRIAQRLFQHVRNGTTDLADEVVTFDAAIYTDPDIARLERERIFRTQPMLAAHVSELRAPGQFVRVRLNESDVLLTRKQDGTVGAFLNVCRHRGGTVCDEARGRRRLFTCKYHGWVYGNDGSLRSISFADSFGELPSDDLGLVTLPVEERHGFIWVMEDPRGGIDVASHLGAEMDEALSELGFEDYHFYNSEILTLPQNWKIMADGLLDGYHVKFIHGATISQYVHHNIMVADVLTDHAFTATPRRRIDDILDTPPGSHALWGRYGLFSAYLCPNSQLVIHPHHTEYWTIYQDPDDPHQCRAHLRFLTPTPVENEEQEAIVLKNHRILVSAVLNEDVPAGNGVQASAGMPGIAPLRLGRNEFLNQLFHRNYARLMDIEAARLVPSRQ